MKPIASRILECRVCGESKELFIFGPPKAKDLLAFERALQAEMKVRLEEARVWKQEHEHGATERVLGEA